MLTRVIVRYYSLIFKILTARRRPVPLNLIFSSFPLGDLQAEYFFGIDNINVLERLALSFSVK